MSGWAGLLVGAWTLGAGVTAIGVWYWRAGGADAWSREEARRFELGKLLYALGALIAWPLMLAIDDFNRAGLRYVFTDWDPWEDGEATTLNANKVTITIGGQHSVHGQESEPVEVVEGSEVIRAHRVWRLYEDERGPVLASTIADHTYTGPVARCDRSEIEAGRGLFAAKLDRPFYKTPNPAYVVEGEVELFGRVVEGEKGYRSEKLRIVSLAVHPGGWHTATSGNRNSMIPGPKPVSGVTRAFCSCVKAERPWPYPYTDLVDALSDRYRCDVEYAQRDGSQVFDERCGQWWTTNLPTGFMTTAQIRGQLEAASGVEPQRIVAPDGLIEEPTTEDIQQYGRP